MQGRLGPDGPVVLVTLPCPVMGVHVVRHTGGFQAKGLPPGRARALLRALHLPLRGRMRLRSTAPAGAGTGVSTAALVALARMAGWRGDPLTLARACHGVEGATDPLMLPDSGRLLWASREGRVVAQGPSLPRCTVVGGFWGPVARTDPADRRFADISDLLAAWRAARSVSDFAALARESAARNAALRGPAYDPTPKLAAGLGAAGWCGAHTGNARGVIFAPGHAPAGAEAALRRAGLRATFRFEVGA